MPELDTEAAGVLTASEQILYEHCQRDGMPASKLKELIQEVLHHPDLMWTLGVNLTTRRWLHARSCINFSSGCMANIWCLQRFIRTTWSCVVQILSPDTQQMETQSSSSREACWMQCGTGCGRE